MRAIQSNDHFSEEQVATMLGKHPVSLRKWRQKNKKAGRIMFGPPYEKIGGNIAYPKDAFREWVINVEIVNGVPHMNAPSKVAEIANAA